jgi:hypothetical protein
MVIRCYADQPNVVVACSPKTQPLPSKMGGWDFEECCDMTPILLSYHPLRCELSIASDISPYLQTK